MKKENRRLLITLGLGLGLILGLFWLSVLSGAEGLGGGLPARASAAESPAIELHVCSSGCAYSSIQAAVDDADPDDVIKVAQGDYTDLHARAGVTQVLYISKTVTVCGGYTDANWTTPDPVAHPTTLDAQGQGRALYVTGNGSTELAEVVTPTIEGLHMTGGNAAGLGGYYGDDVGGGVYVINSAAVISGNFVYGNTAWGGGGLYLETSAAALSGNAIFSNTTTDDGGGVFLRQSDATLESNAIYSNTTSDNGQGGGLYLSSSPATLIGNTITGNVGLDGGGLRLFWSDAVLQDNTLCGNVARGWGGGLATYFSDVTLSGNIVCGNTAGEGGGLDFEGKSPALVNNVVVDNTVNWALGRGAGVRIYRSTPSLLHTTIARNTGGDGSGVHVTGYYYGESGANDPSAVVMDNTIIVSHTAGITVTAGSTVTLNATLWHANAGGNWGGAGTVNHANDRSGDPAFAADGYHLTSASMAIDQGVNAGVTTDVDGDSRPQGGGYDVGADELPATAPDIAWDKQIRVNGGPFQAWDTGPFTVAPGDAVTIVEQVWVTATGTVSFTLGEAWTPSLEWTTYEVATGVVSQSGLTATWSLTNAAPNAWHVLTKTLNVMPVLGYADTLTETLTVQGVPFQLAERIIEFQHPRPQSAWDKTVRVNDGPPQAWNAGSLAVSPGDDVTIVDRVWITHTLDVTFTLAQSWGPTLELDGWAQDAGTVSTSTAGTLTWRGRGEEANQWHTLTTTLHVTGAGWLYESVTETLTVEDATSQPPQRVLGLINLSVSTGCYARINDGSNTYPSVQSAVDVAVDGDLVKVAGRCTGVNDYGGLAQVVYLDKGLTIQGGYTNTNWTTPDPATNPTTLDAQGQGRVFYITGDGSTELAKVINPTVEGLRITGGDATWLGDNYWDRIGGGVYVYAATAVLSGNLIYSNTAMSGGGLVLYYSPATLNNNAIYDNTAIDGGGLASYYLYNDPATLNGNTISGNIAAAQGGGLRLQESKATLKDNVISGNGATYGGGLYLWGSDPTLVNTVVADNTVTDLGPGILVYWSSPRLLHSTIARNTGGDGSGVHVLEGFPSSVTFTNTIIVNHTVGVTVAAGNSASLNATLWHANSGGNTGGAGSISTLDDHSGDPALAADGYHLGPVSAAVDQGVNAGVTTDIDGDARPLDDGYDIGADELSVKRVYLPLVLRDH